MDYIGENVISPAIVDRILHSSRPARIKSGSALYFQVINNAVDDGEAALLRVVKGDLNLRALFQPAPELDRDRLKMKIISSKFSGSDDLKQLLRKDFDIYFCSSGLIYGFRSFAELAEGEGLIFNRPRIVLKVDRRQAPRIETASLPKKYQRECSTVLFSGEKFYRLECELLDVSVGGVGLGISRVTGDKRYEGIVTPGVVTPVEFVLASKPVFAQANFVYTDLKSERAGVILDNVLDNRRHPVGKWIQAWIDKIMFGEAVDLSKKDGIKKRPKRTAIVRTEDIRDNLKKMAADDKILPDGSQDGEAAVGELTADRDDGPVAELSGVAEIPRTDGKAEPYKPVSTFDILLIDSHKAESRLVELFLINRNDYKIMVKTVRDSETGLKTVIQDRPSLVLIDPLLEGDINNGVLLIQRIKANRILRSIPVIGLTSALDRFTVQKLLSAGIKYVVSKKSPLSVLWEKIYDSVALGPPA
ncbi:response regulator [candidate division KSB1 bacterium]